MESPVKLHDIALHRVPVPQRKLVTVQKRMAGAYMVLCKLISQTQLLFKKQVT